MTSGYIPRVVDAELDELMPSLAAISLDGPKGVGKTATASARSTTVLRLDDPVVAELLRAAPEQLAALPKPVLVDEWQKVPETWDRVRRLVDDGAKPSSFLLTGSASPTGVDLHSGAGRIVSLRMRPLSLAEREIEKPTVSLQQLLGRKHEISGTTGVLLADYIREIVASGFPGIRILPDRARRLQLDGYLSRIIDHDFPEQGLKVRRPVVLRAWMAAYAAATGSTTSYERIAKAASPDGQPSRMVTAGYREVLGQLWMLDAVPAWLPSSNQFSRLASTPKHFLADPALAARLLGLDEARLLRAESVDMLGPQDGTSLGRLFEHLVALSLQTYAQAAEATLNHFRSQNGDREVDFIVHSTDGGTVGFEVKLSRTVSDSDVKHLLWLKQHLGDELRDMVVVNTGPAAYRRPDGVAVVPLALLGP
jgi:predicted AAA+ superfamily ATPase